MNWKIYNRIKVKALTLADVYTIFILSIFTLLAIIFFSKLSNSLALISQNVIVIIAIYFLAYIASKENAPKLLILFRRLYFALMIYYVYDQAQYYIRVTNPYLYDDILIKWDYALFGTNPTQWLSKLSFPAFTEYLQLSYMLYFFMPLLHGTEIHYRGKEGQFDEFSRMITFSFYMSYLLYFIMPAIGPRFTLHDFSQMNTDLPGLWLTNFFREFINTGGSIPHYAIHPDILVNRDCMPSGHTWLTMVNMIMAFRYRSKFKWFFLVFGSSLIFSTIYLRYHYVVDVLAGVTCVILAIRLEPKILKLSFFNASSKI